jgi:hypothetical protein
MSKSKKHMAIEQHDEEMEDWLAKGELLHVWRMWEVFGEGENAVGYLTSHYISLFRHEGYISIDMARVFGGGESGRPMVSIDQRVDIRGELEEDTRYDHPYRGLGSDF